MDFQERLLIAQAELQLKAPKGPQFSHPYAWLLKQAGLQFRPPLYSHFLVNLAVYGANFALLAGLAMWFFVWQSQGLAVTSALAASALGGSLYGLFTAANIRRHARHLRLSAWDKLNPELLSHPLLQTELLQR